MSAEQFMPEVGLKMTPSAIEHTKKQLQKHRNAIGLRISLKQAGCSGYKYDTGFATHREPDDEVFHVSDDLDVYVKRKDLPIINGTEVDYITEGLNRTLVFRNPNVTGECGCGESFSVN